MSLPNPDNYQSWQDYARALTTALGAGSDDVVAGSNAGAVTASIPGFNSPPEGFVPLWLDTVSAQIYLANAAFDPPVVDDLFQVDTLNLALAAVTLANMAPNSVDTANIVHAAIHTAQIADAAIITALIGDAQIVTAKIANLAVDTAQIANAAISSAKIANLAVGSAHIQDASITNAKIAGTIQSASWDNATKTGWKLDKAGDIQGRSIAIYDNTGTAIFTAGGTISFDRVTDMLLTAANISTYIDAAAIGTALIADAAIVRALIADAAIGAAQIEDASITTAKIFSLVVDKITSGTLDAVIEVGDGIFSFIVGTSALYLGNGFGDSDQFFLWYGPASVAVGDATEASGVVWLKTDGSAYFGGTLSSGIITNAGQTTFSSATEFVLGSFTSVGGSCTIITNTVTSGVLENSSTWTEVDGDTTDRPADPYSASHHTIRNTYELSKSADGVSYSLIHTYSDDTVSTSVIRTVSTVVDPGTGSITRTRQWEHIWNNSQGNTTTDTLGSGTRWLKLEMTLLEDMTTSASPAGTAITEIIGIRSVEE